MEKTEKDERSTLRVLAPHDLTGLRYETQLAHVHLQTHLKTLRHATYEIRSPTREEGDGRSVPR
jgi:hypothetical protein